MIRKFRGLSKKCGGVLKINGTPPHFFRYNQIKFQPQTNLKNFALKQASNFQLETSRIEIFIYRTKSKSELKWLKP